MILNQQTKTRVDLAGAKAFADQLGKALGLGERDFNVCFVDDDQIRKLNAAYRGKPKPTDVLSFPWRPGGAVDLPGSDELIDSQGEFEGFLGDVVISVETARQNAQAEGHPESIEVSWLILHGLLHLLGMDHETDRGEMSALEHDLRIRLGVSEARLWSRGAKPSLRSRSNRASRRTKSKTGEP